jgi:hypothetical protein
VFPGILDAGSPVSEKTLALGSSVNSDNLSLTYASLPFCLFS